MRQEVRFRSGMMVATTRPGRPGRTPRRHLDLASLRPPLAKQALDGIEVMRILGISSGRRVGALRFLQVLHVARADLSREDAIAALRAWNAEDPGGRAEP